MLRRSLPLKVARLVLALGELRAKMPNTWRRLAVELAIYAIYKEFTDTTTEQGEV